MHLKELIEFLQHFYLRYGDREIVTGETPEHAIDINVIADKDGFILALGDRSIISKPMPSKE